MPLEGMTVKQAMKLKIPELSNGPIHSNVAGSSVSEEKKCFISLERVAQIMVSTSHWLRGIETYAILW